MRVLFVTAADETYAPLLCGLLQSLLQWHPKPYMSLACFDLGLAPETRQWVNRHATHVVEPDWDFEVDETLRAKEPHARALTVRPFLPDYFPGYDIYQWLDADCWVQERYALDWYRSAASRGSLAIAPEIHHAYRYNSQLFTWRARRLQAYFGRETAQQLSWATYFNAGLFALRGDAPHWAAWREAFQRGLQASRGKLICDQSALNYSLWTKPLPVAPMPATCNWLCNLAAPSYDTARKKFCEPVLPKSPLGILHLAGNAKNMCISVTDAHGTYEAGLRFSRPRPR